MSKPKYEPTPEQKAAAKAKRERLRELAAKVSRMTETEKRDLIGLGYCGPDGHQLSNRNQCLLAAQGCAPGVVAGVFDWPAVGRKVMAGQHGFGIWVPIGVQKRGENTDETNGDTPTGFIVRYVFGADQTEPCQVREKRERKYRPIYKPADLFGDQPKPKPANRDNALKSSRLAAMSDLTGVNA